MDYGTLKTTVASYLHRDDLTDEIPTFITLGQARMNHDLKLQFMELKDETLTVTAATKEVALPDGFLEALSVRIPFAGALRALVQKSLVQNSQVYESSGGATRDPLFYARYGDTIELAPIPASDTTLELIYRKKLTAFVEDTDTDEILSDYPNIYLYAALLEGSIYTEDLEKLPTYKIAYDEEVLTLNDRAEEEEWSGAPMQISPSLGVDTP